MVCSWYRKKVNFPVGFFFFFTVLFFAYLIVFNALRGNLVYGFGRKH